LGLLPVLRRFLEASPLDAQTVLLRKRGERHPTRANRPPSLQSYRSRLTDQEWARLSPVLPTAKAGGRSRTSDLRAVSTAILYLDRPGGQGRALPHDFPPWATVWRYLRTWRTDGTWERLHRTLREQTRCAQGRKPTPSAAIIDRQSVKASQKGGSAATRAATKCRVVSSTAWWIPLACSRLPHRCGKLSRGREENVRFPSGRQVPPSLTLAHAVEGGSMLQPACP
jgi:transposase